MDKEITLTRIRELGLVAVLRGPSPALTLDMVDALVRGGVRGIEITYTTPSATDVVAQLAIRYGDEILLGMGTLTDVAQAAEAKAAGAQFLVSPHTDARLGQAMVATGLAVMMGALTPSEVMQAHRLGSDIIKLFPGALVGPAYVKNLRGPFPHIPIMPTGGVSIDNVGEWFGAGVAAVGVGSALCPTDWARDGRFDEITARAQSFDDAVRKAKA